MTQKKKTPAKADFFRLLKPYRGKVLWLSVLTVLLSLLQVLMALLFRFVIDAALGSGKRLLFWGAILVADMLAIVAVNSLLAWSSGSAMDKMMAKLRQQLLKNAVFSRNETMLEHHSGELLSRGMEDVQTVCDGAVSVLPSLVGQVTRLVAAFAAIVAISPLVAGVLLAAAILVGALTACLRPMIRSHHRKVRETDDKVLATMQEDLQQLELVQSLDAQEQILKQFDRRVARNLRARLKRRIWAVGSNTAINAASQIGSGILLLWGASQIAVGALSYGSLTAMLQLLALFRAPVLGLSGLWSRMASIDVAADRLLELLQPVEKQQQLTKLPKITGIVFEKVSFCYPGDEMPVLENFDLTIPLHNWACLTGFSGRGKTTLFKLILGLHKPQSGRIYLQTEDGELPCTEATRTLFAYVPQDYALFSGTILENMHLIAPDATPEQIRSALSAAQADFVWELTEQENTQVRENNTGLSKGQLQRLAIARAILMERPVFLLDECTSALDAQTEDAVLRELQKIGKQALLVTHRPEALQDLSNIESISMEP